MDRRIVTLKTQIISPSEGPETPAADPPAEARPASYWVYIVQCADGSYYAGIATDVQRRLMEHNGITAKGAAAIAQSRRPVKGKGARYTSARRPVTLVFEARCPSRSEAQREEARIKRLTRRQKQALISAATVSNGVATGP